MSRPGARSSLVTRSIRPGCVLQHDAVAIRIFESNARSIPIRVRRLNRLAALRFQSLDRTLPFPAVRQVEDKKVFARW